MGCGQSTPAYYHPDLIVTFTCNPAASCLSQKWYGCKSRGLGAGDPIQCFGSDCGDPGTTDPGWARNSPLRIELVDLLSDALKAMGGWPKFGACCGACCFGQFHGQVAPRLVEAINKVCKKFNDAKLFDMGLQCRAITYIHMNDRYESRLLVLVEKKSEYKLGDVGESLEHLRWLEEMQGTSSLLGMEYEAKSLLAWSPPEDWMTRLTPPYNESCQRGSTNHV